MQERFNNLKTDFVNHVYAGTLVFLGLCVVFVVFLFVSIKRRNKMISESNEIKKQFEEALLKTQLEIQEQTFKSISQEIHDNIGQMLSLAKMNLSKFEMDRQNSDEAVLSAKELVSKAVSELRDLSKTLNTDTISNIGLLRSIELELQLVEKTTGVRTVFAQSGQAQKLPPKHELIVFRIVQEALHNSVKHAQASLLSVKALFDGNILQLSIADNGAGFNTSYRDGTGSGLLNMQSRSQLIGAAWHLESSAEGTHIHLTIPTQNQHDNNSTG